MGLNDKTGQIGRKLYREISPRVDTFTLCVGEIQSAYQLALTSGPDSLGHGHQQLLTEALRFVILSLLFHKDEQVVTKFTDQMRGLAEDDTFDQTEIFVIINALSLFCGATNLEMRKHSFRLLGLLLIHQQVKICFNTNTSLPYLSIPTYFSSYHILFPSNTFRMIPSSKDCLLN
jgi:hypothetical protein